MKRPKLPVPGRSRSPTARLLFATAGTAAAEVLIDTRPKTVRPARGIGAPHRRNPKHIDRNHRDGWLAA